MSAGLPFDVGASGERRAAVVTAGPAAYRRRALAGWGAVLVGAPLACWVLNQGMAAALERWPDTVLPYASLLLLRIGVNVVLAVSLNLINGYTGQFSLGHAGFMAIGAYVSAALMHYARPSAIGADPGAVVAAIWFAATLCLAGVAAAAAGTLVGIPSLRLKGDYLAIVTLGFGEIIRVVLLNVDELGGPRGFSDLEPVADLFWVLVGVIAVVVVTRNMVASTRGLGFLAVRDDEIAAEAVGINTTRYKVTAFVVGAFFAGVGGGLYAHTEAYIIPGAFNFEKSMEVVAIVVLGGLGSIRGSIAAAAGLTLLPELLRGAFLPEVVRDAVPDAVWTALPNWRMVIYSLILIAAMLIQSRGALYRRRRKPAEGRR